MWSFDRYQPFFASVSPGFYDPQNIGVEKMLAGVGRNTGNLFFTAAVHKILGYDGFDRYAGFTFGYSFNPDKVQRKYSCIIVSAANWLKPRTDWLGKLADKIEATKLPCVMIGVGAQSGTTENVPTIPSGTLRLMQVVSERSRSISVRDEFSADVLESYGVKNVDITGCPSLLWNAEAGVNVKKRKSTAHNIVIHGSRNAFDRRIFCANKNNQIDLGLTRIARRRQFDYVAQSELPDIYFACNSFPDEDEYKRSMEFMLRLYGANDRPSLEQYLRNHIKVFFTVEEWLAYLKQKDFSVGTRLHGTIGSLLAGTPALLVTHDTRTRGMAKLLSIPHIDMNEIQSVDQLDFQKLYDSLDLEKFNTSYRKYVTNFVTFFKKNGLRYKFS